VRICAICVLALGGREHDPQAVASHVAVRKADAAVLVLALADDLEAEVFRG